VILSAEGEPFEKPVSNSLLSMGLFAVELRKKLENMNWWETHRKIRELRESCGVSTSQSFTVNVRRPPRYNWTEE
jgi:hypothetical protein